MTAIEVGDLVRMYDFNRPEPDLDYYVEGEVLELNTDSPQCPCGNHIKINATIRVMKDEMQIYPEPVPYWNVMNGTRDLMGILNPVGLLAKKNKKPKVYDHFIQHGL